MLAALAARARRARRRPSRSARAAIAAAAAPDVRMRSDRARARISRSSGGCAWRRARTLRRTSRAAARSRAGETVVTTLDATLQRFAVATLRAHIAELASRRGRGRRGRRARQRERRRARLRRRHGRPVARARTSTAARAPRQAGSTLKPFLYARALDDACSPRRRCSTTPARDRHGARRVRAAELRPRLSRHGQRAHGARERRSTCRRCARWSSSASRACTTTCARLGSTR